MRRLAAALLLLTTLDAVPGATLAQRIRLAIEDSAAGRSAFWGIEIVDQATGKPVFELNANHFFVPASNTKLFTTALALKRLGPDFRFRTTVRMDADGSIRLVGGGDPNLSNRAIPYQKGPATGDPLQAIEDLADQVVARGIQRISGDVIGDDSAYVWQPFPPGWAADDPLWDYGAPTSALSINDNMFTLTVTAGALDGDPVTLELSPAVEFYQIDNRIRTDTAAVRRTSIERHPGSKQLQLWGSLAPGHGEIRDLGIDDPALYAAQAFYDALERRGVAIAGRPLARHLFPDQVPDLKAGVDSEEPPAGTEVAVRTSAPLVEDLRITDKVSHNLHAEMLLRAVARAQRHVGSRQAGLEEMKMFLAEVGIEEDDYHFEDGSGLSRLNLVRPRAVVQLLQHMYAPEWVDLLPVGGEDGTLSTRFGNSRAVGKIHAKTGTLSHVSALSGYASRRSGGVRTFSIMVNNYNTVDSSEIRAIVDKICNLMVE